jgi:ADP-ribose pyrophosphatase
MDIKKVSTEILDKNKWWEYKKDTIVRSDGTPGEYSYTETPGNVLVIPVLDDGRLVLVRQHRYLFDKNSIEFPGGGMNASETPAESAQRELLEESGYVASDLIKVGCFEPSLGVIKDQCHVFIARELSAVSQPQSSPMEKTEVLLRRIDEFEEMIKRGDIWDGQALAAWMMVRSLVIGNL